LDADKIEALLAKEGRWPVIRGSVFLSLCPDKVRTPEQIPAAERERCRAEDSRGTDFSRAWDKLDELRQKLRERCDFFVGVVYGYDG